MYNSNIYILVSTYIVLCLKRYNKFNLFKGDNMRKLFSLIIIGLFALSCVNCVSAYHLDFNPDDHAGIPICDHMSGSNDLSTIGNYEFEFKFTPGVDRESPDWEWNLCSVHIPGVDENVIV